MDVEVPIVVTWAHRKVESTQCLEGFQRSVKICSVRVPREEEFVCGRRSVAFRSRVLACMLGQKSVDSAGEMIDVCALAPQEGLYVRLSVDSSVPDDLDAVPTNGLAGKRVSNREGQRYCRDSLVADHIVGKEWVRCPDHILVGCVVLAIIQVDVAWTCFERFENCASLCSVVHNFVGFTGLSLTDEGQLVHVHPLGLLVDLDVVGDDPALLWKVVFLAMADAEAMLERQVHGAESLLFLGALNVERNEVSFGVYFRTLVGSRSIGNPDRTSQFIARGRCWLCLVRSRPVGESRHVLVTAL